MEKIDAEIAHAKTNFKKFIPKGYEKTVAKCQSIDIFFYDGKIRNTIKISKINKKIKDLEKYFQKGLQRRVKKLSNMEKY